MQIYVSDSVSQISYRAGRVIVHTAENGDSEYPIETVDGMTIFGRPQMSTPFILEMLKRQLGIHLFDTDGHYKGRIAAPQATHAARLRTQVRCAEDRDFCLAVSKSLIATKIGQQQALIAAHQSDRADLTSQQSVMRHSLRCVHKAETLAELNGFEGNAAKGYLAALQHIVPTEFAFTGRSRRPPTDPFNSMLSLGYSLLYKNVIGAIERHGLNAYIGYLHQDSRGHATLASDLMEVWRVPVIDDRMLRLVAEQQVPADGFTTDPDTGAVYGTRETTRAIARAVGNRLARTATYINGDPHRYTVQYALDLQIESLVRALDIGNPTQLAGIDISTEHPGNLNVGRPPRELLQPAPAGGQYARPNHENLRAGHLRHHRQQATNPLGRNPVRLRIPCSGVGIRSDADHTATREITRRHRPFQSGGRQHPDLQDQRHRRCHHLRPRPAGQRRRLHLHMTVPDRSLTIVQAECP